jgi:hypothetical protein
MPKVNPNINTNSANFYSSTFKSRNAGCEYALAAFPILYKKTLFELRGRFDAEELKLMLELFNGRDVSPDMVGQHLTTGVIETILLDFDSKRLLNLSVDELKAKVEALSAIEAACLEIWATGYWRMNYVDRRTLNKYVSALVKANG